MYVYSCIGYKFLTWSLVFISSKYVMKFSIFERTAMQHDMQTQRTHNVTLLELKVVTNKYVPPSLSYVTGLIPKLGMNFKIRVYSLNLHLFSSFDFCIMAFLRIICWETFFINRRLL